MTTYSKMCPKCQTANDLAATTCKRCKLKFGTPVEAAAKPKNESSTLGPRAGIIITVVGLLILILGFQIFGSMQERARRQEELKKNSWDAYIKKRDSGALQ